MYYAISNIAELSMRIFKLTKIQNLCACIHNCEQIKKIITSIDALNENANIILVVLIVSVSYVCFIIDLVIQQ